MLVGHISIRGFDDGLAAIGENFRTEVLELLVMLLKVLPGDALQLGGLEDALVGQFFDAPDQPVQVHAQAVD
jgi:hypothetical protein